THVDWAYLYAKCWRGGLDSSKHSNSGGYGRVSNDRCSRDVRCNFLEQFKPFTSEAVFERDEPSSVAARPRQTIYEASAAWVCNQHKHDWHGAGHLQQRCHARSTTGDNYVGCQSNEFRRVLASGCDVARAPSVLDPRLRPTVQPNGCSAWRSAAT